jgi:hypothetical protein
VRDSLPWSAEWPTPQLWRAVPVKQLCTSAGVCMMKRSFPVLVLGFTVLCCRGYDLDSRVTDDSGLVPPDQYARYGREQAEEIAIAREFGHARKGSSPDDLAKQADAAMSYARTLPDVADIRSDPLGLRLTIRFKSGWRTMVTPITDGKRGAETAGLPGGASRQPSR